MNAERLSIPLVHGVRRGAGVKRRSEKTLLQEAREWIVRRYRQSPNLWPAIDSKWDRWYRPEEWTNAGEYLGPQAVDNPVDKPALSTAERNVVDRKAYQREWTKRKRAAATAAKAKGAAR